MVTPAATYLSRYSTWMERYSLVSYYIILNYFKSQYIIPSYFYSGLEKYWQFAFAWFFRPYLTAHDHLWTMQPVELPPVSVEWPWHSLSYLAKVHFQCPVIGFALYLFSIFLLIIFVQSKGCGASRLDVEEGTCQFLVPHASSR